MIIVLDGALKYNLESSKAVLITKKGRESPKARKHMIVGDVDIYRTSYLRTPLGETDVIPLYYNLGKNYLASLRIPDKNVIILANLSQGLDIGLSIYLLEKISGLRDLEEVVLIGIVPATSRTTILSRIYSWLLITGVYDIFLNSRKEGLFKLILVDENIPPQLSTLLVNIVEEGVLRNIYSTLELRLKRYILPVIDTRLILRFMVNYAMLESVDREYKTILVLLHHLLDKAPSELWEYFRSEENIQRIRALKYRLEHNRNNRMKIGEVIHKIGRRIYLEPKYTEPLIDPLNMAKYMLSLEGLSKIYMKNEIVEKIRGIVENIEDLDVERITKIQIMYPPLGGLGEGYRIVVSKDLYPIVKSIGKNLEMHVTEKYPNMLLLIKHRIIPICDQCSKELYGEFTSLRQAYIEDHYNVRRFYPEKIYVNNVAINREDIYRCEPINYMGYKIAKTYNDIPPCKDLIKKIEYALL